MNRRPLFPSAFLIALVLLFALAGPAAATTIDEILMPPSTPGNSYSGTFVITPSVDTWAFGVGNDDIEDTSISGIKQVDGLDANDHWVSALISQNSWTNGFDFDSIRPIGATPPSSFSIDTTSVAWQWGSSAYVAFYWLSEAGTDAGNPQAVLQAGNTYDAFRFFASNPNSPFAAFSAADGGAITSGETIVSIIPEPATASLLALGLVGIALGHRRSTRA